jgi:hypothetical protein
MRRLWFLVFLVACGGPQSLTPLGQWEAVLACDVEGGEPVPACVNHDVLLLDIEGTGPFHGSHLSMFPGYTRADGAYSGMVGTVQAEFVGGELEISLLGDVDYTFASEGDSAAWSDHHLVLIGRFASSCWDARMAWVGSEGAVDLEGVAAVRRLGVTCP